MGKSHEPFIVIDINCNPIVKAYLENNFGNPVDLPVKHVLYKLTTALLVKNNTRTNNVAEYSSTVKICVLKKVFAHDGFNISDVGVRNFTTGVENFIKQALRHHVDTMMMMENNTRYRLSQYKDLLQELEAETIHRTSDVKQRIKSLRHDIECHEVDIKKAINTTISDFLKLDQTVLPYETAKKDYYRYRLKKFSTQMSPNIKTDE